MRIRFFETGKLSGSSYEKYPSRSNAIFNIEKSDKYCFIWAVLAHLQPCENNYPNRVSSYRQNFNELNIQDFVFENGFKCSNMHKFEKSLNFSINNFELNFHQDQNKGKHDLIPIENSKN